MSYDRAKVIRKIIGSFENHENPCFINHDYLDLKEVTCIDEYFMDFEFWPKGSYGDPTEMRMRLFFDRSGIYTALSYDDEPIEVEFVWGLSYQGLEFQKVCKDVFRIFKLHRKYAPKYLRY
jgi:hypothetical protein